MFCWSRQRSILFLKLWKVWKITDNIFFIFNDPVVEGLFVHHPLDLNFTLGVIGTIFIFIKTKPAWIFRGYRSWHGILKGLGRLLDRWASLNIALFYQNGVCIRFDLRLLDKCDGLIFSTEVDAYFTVLFRCNYLFLDFGMDRSLPTDIHTEEQERKRHLVLLLGVLRLFKPPWLKFNWMAFCI